MLLICRQHTLRPIALALKKSVYAMADAKNASNITLRRANYLTVQDSLIFSSQHSQIYPRQTHKQTASQILLYFKKYSLYGVFKMSEIDKLRSEIENLKERMKKLEDHVKEHECDARAHHSH